MIGKPLTLTKHLSVEHMKYLFVEPCVQYSISADVRREGWSFFASHVW